MGSNSNIHNFFKGFVDIFSKPQEKRPVDKSFQIADECGLIMGNLLHTIKNEDACKIKCRAQCMTIELEYGSSFFNESLKSCNTCECNCK